MRRFFTFALLILLAGSTASHAQVYPGPTVGRSDGSTKYIGHGENLVIGNGLTAAQVQATQSAVGAFSAVTYGLKMDGATDDSVALRTACAAVSAAGGTKLAVSGVINAPNYLPADCANVVLSGTGSIIGTYGKRVVPINAAFALPPTDTLKGANLTRWNAALAAATTTAPALVCIIGDSHTIWNANNAANTESLWSLIVQRISALHPTTPISYQNFGIGGTAWINLSTTPATFPSWYANHATVWGTFPATATAGTTTGCDLVIVNLGFNSPSTDEQQATLDAGIASISSGSKVPSIILGVNLTAGLENPANGYSSAGSQDLKLRNAYYTRSYAIAHNYGYIDIFRRAYQVRDGADPFSVQFNGPIYTSAATANTWASPVTEIGGFSLKTTFNTGLANGAGVLVGYGNNTYNAATFTRDTSTGKLTYQVQSDASHVNIATTLSSVVLPAIGTQFILEVDIKGTEMSVFVTSVAQPEPQLVFAGNVPTFGGLTVPVLLQANATAWTASAISLQTATFKAVQPEITDLQMFGTVAGTDGNGSNHPTAKAIQVIDAPVVNALAF